MTEVERIADQLNRVFEGDAWHGPSVREVLKDVSAEKAAKKPIPNAHSIWELVLHIAAWENAVRRRIEGDNVDLTDEEDYPPIRDTSESAWQKAMKMLENGHRALRKVVSGLTDSRLEELIRGRNYSVYYLLHGIIQHDIYHVGQIALLKKAG